MSKVVDSCHVPPSIRYSQPVMVLRIIFVAVLDDSVGASGAVCGALVTVVVAAEVTLPVQLAAVTVTVIVAPMSSCTKV